MRFEIRLHDEFLIITVVSHPLLKTAWIHDNDKKNEAIKLFKDALLIFRLYGNSDNSLSFHSTLHQSDNGDEVLFFLWTFNSNQQNTSISFENECVK